MRTPYLANQAQHQPHNVGTGLGYSARLMLGVLAPSQETLRGHSLSPVLHPKAWGHRDPLFPP